MAAMVQSLVVCQSHSKRNRIEISLHKLKRKQVQIDEYLIPRLNVYKIFKCHNFPDKFIGLILPQGLRLSLVEDPPLVPPSRPPKT